LHGLAGGDGVVVLAPLVAVGRIDELEVEAFVGQLVIGKGAAELDVLGVLALGFQDEHVGTGDGRGLGIEFLPLEEDLGLGVDLLDAILGNGQHAAGAAAAVMDGAGHALATGQVGIKHEDQIHHEADDLTRGEVLAGVLVQRFVELPQQVLKDIAHLVVGHGAGAEDHLARLIEALHEQVEQPGPLQIADGVVEVEGGKDFPDVRGEAHDILPEIQRQIGVIVQEALVVELGGNS